MSNALLSENFGDGYKSMDSLRLINVDPPKQPNELNGNPNANGHTSHPD